MDSVQDMERLFISAGLQVIGRRLQMNICLAVSRRTLFLPAVGAIASKTAKAAETAISPITSGISITACTSGISVFAFIHNLLIGLLHFFKPGFRLIAHGVVDIRIGMVLSAQRPVCFFYLFVGCIP